jgi:hypothetical protein
VGVVPSKNNLHNSTPLDFYVVSTCDMAFLAGSSKNDRDADADADLHITISTASEPNEPDTQKKRQSYLVPQYQKSQGVGSS